MVSRLAIFLSCVFFFMLQVTSLMLEENQVPFGYGREASWKIYEEEFNVLLHRESHSNTSKDPDGYVPSRVPEVRCSRQRSRVAREIIEEHLMPFVEREKYQLSRKCGLNLDNDFFKDQEHHKNNVDINEWQCGYCNNTYPYEGHLDRHFALMHGDTRKSDGNCLADLCGALHCDIVMYSEIMRYRKKPICSHGAAEKNRHLCKSLADSCFPAHEGSSASWLHDLFMRQFCDAHTCSVGPKPFSIRVKKHTSNITLAAMSVLLMLLILRNAVDLHKSWKEISVLD